MAENDQSGSENGSLAADEQIAPQLRVITQYIKDMSFENPGAPQSLTPQSEAPKIGVNVDVGVRGLSDTDFEVEIKLSIEAMAADKPIFIVELTYAGICRLENIPKESMQAVLLIECPRMIFPFARRIVADATRDGGFPPLMIDPIDFALLYRQQMSDTQSTVGNA